MLPEKVDAAPLVAKLVQKTQSGKIPWQPTAEDNAFIAAVGKQSFRVRLKDISEDWQNAEIVPVLELFDEQSKLVWSVRSVGGLHELHELAQRVANRIDERVDELMSALDELE